MTGSNPERSDSTTPEPPSDKAEQLVAEARAYLQDATTDPDGVLGERARIVELLAAETTASVERDLERRAAASGALAVVAESHPNRLAGSVPALTRELRAELSRPTPGEPELRASSCATREQLVMALSHVLSEEPALVSEVDGVGAVRDALSTDFDDGTARVATRALFAVADERPGAVVPAVDWLAEMTTHSDSGVRALSAATLGRLAADHHDAVAPAADTLRDLLGDDDAVQHNAAEALVTLAGPRPDAVVSAAEELRQCLTHDEIAIQHNAAGALGRLATAYPEAVRPAVADLRTLCEHDEAAVRQTAAAALARLARDQ